MDGVEGNGGDEWVYGDVFWRRYCGMGREIKEVGINVWNEGKLEIVDEGKL